MKWGVIVSHWMAINLEAAFKLLREKNIKHVELGVGILMYLLGSAGRLRAIVETWGYKPPKREEIKRRVEGFKELLVSYGIEPLQMHGPGLNLVSEALEVASQLGVGALVVHPTNTSGLDWEFPIYASKVREANIKMFKELVKKAEDLGVIMAVENMLRGTYGSTPSDLLNLVNEVGSESLGICLDTGHANVNGFPPHEFLVRITGHLVATHVHDNDGSGDQHLPPLMGNIDWRSFFKVLKESGYPKPIIYEVGLGRSIREEENRLRLLRCISEKLLSEQT